MEIKEIALKIMKAWEEKDEATMRAHLHPDYISKDPMETTKGVDKTIEKMKIFPFKGRVDTEHFISEGDTVVAAGIWHVDSPIKAEVPIISLTKFEKDKIKEKRIYFDPARVAM